MKKIKFTPMSANWLQVFKDACAKITFAGAAKKKLDHTQRSLYASATELYAKLSQKTIFAHTNKDNKLSITIAQGCAFVALIKDIDTLRADLMPIIQNIVSQIDQQTV